MGKEDLTKIFVLTGLAGIVCSVGALFFSQSWALSYFLISTVALVNWMVLAMIFVGMAKRRPLLLVVGLMLKPMTLLGYLLLGVQGVVTLSTLLAGLNTFFVILLLYMAFRRSPLKKNAAKSAPMSEVYG